MKRILLAAAVLAVTAFAGAESVNAPAGTVVTVNTDVTELAQGYQMAFSALSKPPILLAFQRNNTTLLLEDVKSVKHAGGVLIVEVGRGMQYLINARDVLYITDGKVPLPPKETPAH